MEVEAMSNPTMIRVVTFKEGELFVAQALEVDVCAQGKTMEEANRRLSVLMHVEEEEAKANGRTLFDIGPAPHPFHVLYNNHCVVRSEARVA
jgi:predicted RNase H-like HicB family nuclease